MSGWSRQQAEMLAWYYANRERLEQRRLLRTAIAFLLLGFALGGCVGQWIGELR